MRVPLQLHPDSRGGAVSRITVEVARQSATALVLHYFVTGRIGTLNLAPPAAPERADALWEHSCFEAFVRRSSAGADDGYYELNFAPSTQWAAYRFSDYREGMEAAAELDPPRIETNASDLYFQLRASFDLPDDGPWRLGLAAVIEEENRRKSWWALAHPPGKPDFHHQDCFAVDLPAAQQT